VANIILFKQQDEIRKLLTKTFQSGNINFLIGSGASNPAIQIAGDVEAEIDGLFKADKNDEANKKIYEFLTNIQTSMNALIKGTANTNNGTVLNSYVEFIRALSKVLTERKTNLLPRQANIFTSNYDLFVEKASERFPTLKLNDGFNRTPNLSGQFSFSPQNFFNSVFNSGNLYNYKVEIPSLNLIKIHGSLSWKKTDSDILHHVSEKSPPTPKAGQTQISKEQIEEYNKGYALILPQQGKFRETMMDRVFYDLLRLYANELDKENTVLIAFGFSFVDQHIFDITKRALKNPTLKLIIFSYDATSVAGYSAKFDGYNNVDIISPEGNEKINFGSLNGVINGIFKQEEEDVFA
jgi:hypothetical protein